MTKWFGAGHLQILKSMVDVPRTVTADNAASADKHDPAEVMLRKIRQKAPVTRRRLWRSYDDPKASWFESTLHGLFSAGKIVQTDEGIVVLDHPGDSVAVKTVVR